jgi:hypothetical protein
MAASGIVDKATSDMLIGPDWVLNLELCDVINSDPTQSRDVIKAVKKRLSNRNPVVQLLTLTVSIPLLYLVVKHQVELWMLLPVLWLGQSKQNCEGPVHVHWLNGFDVNSMPIYMLEGDMPAKNR